MNSELDVEETRKFVEFGIIVFNENGRKLYFKPRKLSRLESMKESVKNSILEYELIPVSTEEKQKLGIEESEHQQGEEFDIEESEKELSLDEKLKKVREHEAREKEGKNLTLSGDPNAVASAKKILENAQNKDSSKDDLAEENEHLKTTLQLIAEKQAIKKCDELGIKNKEMRDEYIAHPDKLKAYEDGLKGKGRSAPSGTNWVNPDYNNGTAISTDNTSLAQKVYPSYEAMLQDLHDREFIFQGSQKGVEATRMLEAITRKFFEAHKETNSPVPILQKPLPKLISVNGLLTPEDPSLGDLQERNRIFRRRKIMEREERGSVAVGESE